MSATELGAVLGNGRRCFLEPETCQERRPPAAEVSVVRACAQRASGLEANKYAAVKIRAQADEAHDAGNASQGLFFF
jgi:hypothetical protein